MLMILIERIDRGARRVLVRVSYGVARHRGLVSVGALATEVAFFDVLLGVVPRTTAGGHRDGDEDARDDGADEQAAERADAGVVAEHQVERDDEHDRHEDRQQRRNDHLANGGPREQVYRARVIRLRRAFHDALDLAELTAHFGHHRARRATHRFHRHGGEEVGHETADEQDR